MNLILSVKLNVFNFNRLLPALKPSRLNHERNMRDQALFTSRNRSKPMCLEWDVRGQQEMDSFTGEFWIMDLK